MVKNIAAIAFIYVCVCVAWVILGNVVMDRSYSTGRSLGDGVEQLWGASQKQDAPQTYYREQQETIVQMKPRKTEMREQQIDLPLAASDIKVNLHLEQRKKGLLWYPTYKVNFAGKYQVKNPSEQPQRVICAFTLPSQQAVYDNLKFAVGGTALSDISPNSGGVIFGQFVVPAHATGNVEIAYDSQGLGEWRYAPGAGAAQVRDFKMQMQTDFDKIDFPQGTRSPTSKEKLKNGWLLNWDYGNTVTGSAMGMAMPKLLNPGPWVGQITFFAPVSLFFFFFSVWLITTIKGIRIHPMHYFFIGAAFFSFHLLMAYSVDQIPVETSFVIASAVSIFLVLSYIRRAVPDKRFFVQVALAQFFYLIFFSFTFFIEQFTGLIITCMSVCTLFLSMQYTARFNWSTVFGKKQLAAADPMSLIDEGFAPQP